jgi:hypothetical protein
MYRNELLEIRNPIVNETVPLELLVTVILNVTNNYFLL